MNKIDKNTSPYLQLLTVRTRLSESPLANKMLVGAALRARAESEEITVYCALYQAWVPPAGRNPRQGRNST